MRRFIAVAVVSLGAFGLASGTARAQLGFYNRPVVNARPTVSPYINMFGANNPAAAYFGIVRPEMQMGQALMGIQNQFQNLQGDINQLGITATGQENQLITGHPVMFMNYSYYYPMFGNRGGVGGGGLGMGGGGGGGTGVGIVGGAGRMPTGTGGGIRR